MDGKLEVGIRRGVMTALDSMQVIVDPFRVNFGGQFIEMDGQFGQMSGIVGEDAFAFADNNNFLFKLGKQFSKTCYIRTGSLDEVFFYSCLPSGRFPEGISEEDLKKVHRSKPRNPLLADVCFKAGYIDSWGRGTIKIIEACKNAGLPEPVLKEDKGLLKNIGTKGSSAVYKLGVGS
ncbi:ATP-binding protein [Algoriphagus sp.]|uniref:ATP-binding protein n=1 Tax=Algoriphagus sp. TaxID=1872435 RepID=UPI003F7213B0